MESFTIDTGKTGSNRAEEEEDGECDDEGLDLPDFSEIPGGSTLKVNHIRV